MDLRLAATCRIAEWIREIMRCSPIKHCGYVTRPRPSVQAPNLGKPIWLLKIVLRHRCPWLNSRFLLGNVPTFSCSRPSHVPMPLRPISSLLALQRGNLLCDTGCRTTITTGTARRVGRGRSYLLRAVCLRQVSARSLGRDRDSPVLTRKRDLLL